MIFHLPADWSADDVLRLLARCGLPADAKAWPPRVSLHPDAAPGREAWAVVQPLYDHQVATRVSDHLREHSPGWRPLWSWRTVMHWS